MMRKSLGRGLDALIDNTSATAQAPVGASGPGITIAPIESVMPGPFQPRTHFDVNKLQELTRAIESQGIVEPLIVRITLGASPLSPAYQLIAGERRLRAARKAGLETVPVIVRELDDRAALEMSLVENLAREDLSPVEEGTAFARLSREFGLSHEQIAERIGKSRPYVTNAIRVIELPMEILEMIARGDLTIGQARPLLAIDSPDAQLAAARGIVDGRITARGAEEIAGAHRRRKSSDGARSSSDPNLDALTENLQRALKRKVRIIRKRGKKPGRIELDYYDENDLTALAATLSGAARSTTAHA